MSFYKNFKPLSYPLTQESTLFTQKDLDIILCQDVFNISYTKFYNLVYVRNYSRSKAFKSLTKGSEIKLSLLNEYITYLSNILLFTTRQEINNVYKHCDSQSCMSQMKVGLFYELNKIGVLSSPNFRVLINLKTGLILDSFYGSHSNAIRKIFLKLKKLDSYVASEEEFFVNTRKSKNNIPKQIELKVGEKYAFIETKGYIHFFNTKELNFQEMFRHGLPIKVKVLKITEPTYIKKIELYEKNYRHTYKVYHPFLDFTTDKIERSNTFETNSQELFDMFSKVSSSFSINVYDNALKKQPKNTSLHFFKNIPWNFVLKKDENAATL